MKRKSAAVFLALIICLGLAGCPHSADHTAAVAVQKYAVYLDGFQKGEIKAHDAQPSFVPDSLHDKIQSDFIAAAKAGKDLDKGILVAKAGGDPKAFIDAALGTAGALEADVRLVPDPVKEQELQLLLKVATDVLDNAITFLKK